MGNSSTKESRTSTSSDPSNTRHGNSSGPSSFPPNNSGDRPPFQHASRSSRGSRHEIPFLSMVAGGMDRDPGSEPRKESRQEREARRAEKERVARAKERERSMKEEHVDGGYLVTLGTYVGTEDFSKPTVRQLMIERRLAPFWRGLNDHSDSWTEHQLVAAARGLPIPAADEIPPEEISPMESNGAESTSRPITFRSPPAPSNNNHLSVSHPHFPGNNSSPGTTIPSASPMFRSRSKTLASLASSRSASQSETTPQEIRLPHEPQINGQPVEAYLYKDATECPICFLYYPPYLNKTRCCDQPICSECFVQIKRPDPHPPEHVDPNAPAPQDPQSPQEEGQLMSEPAACPFCVQSEFGVSYEPPPFRRGLAYSNQLVVPVLGKQSSAMSSQSSLSNSNGPSTPTGSAPMQRRRTQSLSATAPTVITTDRVRPDWAKKLSDARAQAARRSAAATALHTAAYTLGSNGSASGFAALGRRRRYISSETGGAVEADDSRPPEGFLPNVEAFLAAIEGAGPSRGQTRSGGSADLFPGRISSRGNRADDLEEIMMMEAIRQSLAAEEERRKKEEKEASKEAKKEEKKRAKEQKKADKAARKNGLYPSSANASTSFQSAPASPSEATEPSPDVGKGKAKVSDGAPPTSGFSAIGFNPLNEPTSTLNSAGKSPKEDLSRSGSPQSASYTNHQRGLSELSASTVSSAGETGTAGFVNLDSLKSAQDANPRNGTAPLGAASNSDKNSTIPTGAPSQNLSKPIAAAGTQAGSSADASPKKD